MWEQIGKLELQNEWDGMTYKNYTFLDWTNFQTQNYKHKETSGNTWDLIDITVIQNISGTNNNFVCNDSKTLYTHL